MPHGLRDLAAYGLGYAAQAYAYALLLTDRYPNSDPNALGPAWSLPPHPVRLELDDDGRRSRLTVFFRLLLALPHFVWLALWGDRWRSWPRSSNWFVALVRGRSAEPLHRFLAAYVRYSAHVTAFVAPDRQPVPRLRRRTGLSRSTSQIGAARAAEPLGHLLPDVPRDPGVPHLRRARRRPLRRGHSSAGSPRSSRAGCRPACGTSARLRSATRRRRTRTGSSSPTVYPYASPALRPPPEPEAGAGARAGAVRGNRSERAEPAAPPRPSRSSSPGSGRPPRGRSGTAPCRASLSLPDVPIDGIPQDILDRADRYETFFRDRVRRLRSSS